jgi:glycosyltransferase involved in cell wall biosynthesis
MLSYEYEGMQYERLLKWSAFPMIGANLTYRYVFTVFTPTYNRISTLSRVYESLKQQTFRDFEWLIVDDGSTDNTHDLVAAWQKEALFPIRYIWQENQGKHIAFNRAVQEAQGECFLTLDSDDACVPEALERFKYHWDSIPHSKRAEFTAVTCLCVDQCGTLVGNEFPHSVIDSNFLEMRYRFKVKGEKWGFHRTDILKLYPFPEIIKRKTFPEGVIWQKIDRKYKTRFINERLRIYFVNDTSTPARQLPGKNSIGGQLEHLTTLNEQIDYFRYAPWEFCRSAINYTRFSFHIGEDIFEQFIELSNILSKILWLMTMPAGLLLYWRDKIRLVLRNYISV